jgi:hypothetical protein
MRLRLSLDGADYSDVTLVDPITIEQDSTQAISTAELHLAQERGIARYDEALYDVAVYAWEVIEWQEIRLWDEDSGQTLFAGLVLEVERVLDNQHMIYICRCSDYGIVLERSLATATWPNGTPDSTIVTDLIAGTGISPGTIITYANNLGVIEAKDNKVREMLDAICELTGSEWHVSYAGQLNYYRQGSILPPFGLSDTPDHSTTQPYQMDDYSTDFTNAANRVVVLGSINGTELTAVAQDTASQARYGVLSGTVVNRNLTDPVTAQLLADTEVAERAWPRQSVTASLYVPGLARGQTVHVRSGKFSIDADLILRSLTIVIAAPDRARPVAAGHVLKYTASLGTRPPDLVYKLRRLEAQSRESTIQPTAPIPPGSIDGDDLASTIAPIYIVSVKPTDWTPYRADATFFNTTDRKLYRRVGNDWTAVVPSDDITGQLQTSQLAPGSVTTTVLADGSVVTAKIPAGAIQEPQIAASAVTANAIAANAVYTEALQANAITSIKIAANAVVAGKIAALAVLAGNIAADAVTAGTIAAAAIRAEDAAFAAAAIQSADINELHGNKIIANTITGDRIIAGSISSDKLNATEIRVGGGGGKPGKFGVYGASGTQIGFIGVEGAYDGLWSSRARFGGTGPADAKVRIIDNAYEMEISGPSSTVKVSNVAFDPSFSTIGVQVYDATNATWHVSRGLVLYAGSTQIGAIARNPSTTNLAEVVLYTPGTASISFLASGLGTCRVGTRFEVGGNLGLSQAVDYAKAAGGSGTLTFTGGILTGYT